MSTKRLSLTVFTVLSILAFTFTVVGAQGITSGGDMEIPDFSEFTPLSDDYVPEGGVGLDVVGPMPLSPYNNIIYNKTPKFYFTSLAGASEYRIAVVDLVASPDVLVYTYTGAGTCGTAYCWLQPSTKLKTIQYGASSGGIYTWAVQARVGDEWQAPSSSVLFLVLSKGFTSTFDVDTKKWQPITGTWARTTKGYYKTNGVYLSGASAMQKELFFDNYVYEVKMKRKVAVTNPNRIFISGDPSSLFSTNIWNDGYIFQYSNDGEWSVFKADNGVLTTLQTWVATPFVETYSWNTLSVWKVEEGLHFWINGVYMGYVSDTSLNSGYVGVGMFQSVNGPAPLLVDYAKLYYSAVWPFAVPLTENGEVDPAFELIPDATTTGNPDSSQ